MATITIPLQESQRFIDALQNALNDLPTIVNNVSTKFNIDHKAALERITNYIVQDLPDIINMPRSRFNKTNNQIQNLEAEIRFIKDIYASDHNENNKKYREWNRQYLKCSENLSGVRRQLYDAQNQVLRIKNQTDSMSKQRIDELNKKIEVLTAEVNSLDIQRVTLKSDLTYARNKAILTRQSLDELAKINDKTKQNIQELLRLINQTDDNPSMNLDEMIQQLKDYIENNMKLTKTIDELNDELFKTKIAAVDMTNLQNRSSKLQQENARLKQNINDIIQERNDEKHNIDILEQNYTDIEEKHRKLLSEAKSCEENYTQKLESMEKQHNKVLSEYVTKLKNIENERNEAFNKLSEIQNKCDETTAQLNELQRNYDQSNNVKNYESLLLTYNIIKQQHLDTTTSLYTIQSDFDRLNVQYQTLISEKNINEQKIQTLELERQKIENAYAESESNITKLKENLNQLQIQNDNLTLQIENLQTQLESTRDISNTVDINNMQSQDKNNIEQLQQKIYILEETVKQNNITIDDGIKKYQLLTDQLNTIAEQLNISENNYQIQAGILNETQKSRDEIKNELENKYNELEVEYNKVKNLFNTLEETNKTLKSQINILLTEKQQNQNPINNQALLDAERQLLMEENNKLLQDVQQRLETKYSKQIQTIQENFEKERNDLNMNLKVSSEKENSMKLELQDIECKYKLLVDKLQHAKDLQGNHVELFDLLKNMLESSNDTPRCSVVSQKSLNSNVTTNEDIPCNIEEIDSISKNSSISDENEKTTSSTTTTSSSENDSNDTNLSDEETLTNSDRITDTNINNVVCKTEESSVRRFGNIANEKNRKLILQNKAIDSNQPIYEVSTSSGDISRNLICTINQNPQSILDPETSQSIEYPDVLYNLNDVQVPKINVNEINVSSISSSSFNERVQSQRTPTKRKQNTDRNASDMNNDNNTDSKIAKTIIDNTKTMVARKKINLPPPSIQLTIPTPPSPSNSSQITIQAPSSLASTSSDDTIESVSLNDD